MKKVSDNDKMTMSIVGDIDVDITHMSKNFSIGPSKDFFGVLLNRKVSFEEIKNIEIDRMPGFRFSWKYDKDMEPWTKHKTRNGVEMLKS